MPKVPANARVSDLSQTASHARRSGFLARIGQSVRYAITGVGPETWMSPDQPVQPTAQEARGRQFDYRVGANLFYTPRGTELTSFEQLRTLADNCDIVRLAIETRKDQIAALDWMIGNVDPDKDAPDDPKTRAVEAILAKPDGLHTWQAWVRMLLEELLVIDAPTIYPRTRNDGGFYGFELLDGSTIKPLIDAQGRSPLPPSPAYQQVLKGLPAVDYTRDELLYVPRNPRVHKFYGFSPVEQILLTVNIALRRSVNQLEYFTNGTIPAAFATLPANWTPQQIAEFQEYWDTVVEGDQSRNRQVRFAPDGSKITLLKEAPLQDAFDEWLARIVCFCFSLPPTPFVKQMNRATAQQQQESGLQEGLTPLKMWVKEILDHLIQVRLGYTHLEFRWQDAAPIDPQIQATVLTAYQKQGNFSVNDVRAKLGEEPINEDWANAYVIITATGATPLEDLIAQSHIATENAANPPAPAPHDPNDPNAAPPAPGQNPSGSGRGVAKPKPPATEAGAAKDDDGAEKLGKAEHVDEPLNTPDEPLDKRGRKIKGAVLSALELIRDNAIAQLSAVGKAADGSHKVRDTGAAAYAAHVDLTPLTLAFDDVQNALEAVAVDGSRQQVLKIIADEPAVLTALKERGVDFMDYQAPGVIQWAKKRAADLIATDGDGGMLADATRNMIRATITKALEEHATDAQLAEALEKAYAFSEQRAELIARTEVRNALEQGGYQTALDTFQNTAAQKKWLLSNDEGVCPVCEANAAEGWIGLKEPFSSGDMAPLAHPRCRCVGAYRRKPKEG